MLFSVIIPLYNKASYIERTLRSVISQSFSDFEVIVVDDGSTDGGAEIADSILAESGVEYQLIRKPNGGVGSARNEGINASRGQYVCFLDGDDWWAPEFLERMAWLIENYPDAGLYCTNYYYVKHGRNNVKLDIPTGYFNYCREYARTMCMSATSSSACVSREILDEMGGFKPWLKLGEDFDLWIRIALKYGIAIVDEPLAYYFNDLPPAHRATHHLHKPENHMLWNLDYLAEEEKRNPDYKLLIDKLRAGGLLSYHLSREWREAAAMELAKVDWNHIPASLHTPYLLPRFLVKSKAAFMRAGARMKRKLLSFVR